MTEEPENTPRWVKVFGIVAVVLAIVVVLALLIGGKHGPGRHAGDAGEQTVSGGVAAHVEQR